MQVFYSLPKLIGYANSVIEDKEVVSLDIFDTLFVRRIFDPDMIKLPVARFIARHANNSGIDISWQEVQAMRDEIESFHRARNGAIHPDHEANYDQFIPEVLQRIHGNALPAGLADAVSDYEMKMETSVLTPRADLVDWIKQLHENRKKIILISDIYLPSKYLKRLVEAKGLSGYFTDVVSSADSFRAKASGTGFERLQSRHGIDYSKWLHVGDNIISDGVRCDELGITSLVIQDIGEKQRKGIARLINSLAKTKHIWKGRNVLQLMLPLEAENGECPELFADGHNLFGMILGYFLQHLAEQCVRRGIKRVYFCSREGWMFYECWKRMQPYLFPNGSAPEASYLYVSRMGLSKASCANVGLNAANTAVALLPPQNIDFLDICRVYQLDLEPLRDALDRAGLKPGDKIVPLGPDATENNPNNPFSVLLQDPRFQEQVRAQGKQARDDFGDYLESEGFFDHEDVALVDIGWLGTIQNYLHEAIMHRAQRPNIHGFLLAATRMVPYPNTAESHYEGLVFDQNKFNLAASYILTAKDVFEEICRAPHPSVTGYQRSERGVKPVLRSGEDASARLESEQSSYYKPLQDGVLQAVERYAVATSILGYRSNFIRPWLNFYIVSRLAFPSAREVRRIKHFFHQDDFAANRKLPRILSRVNQSLWDIKPYRIALLPFTRSWYFYRHISRMLRLWA